MKNKYKVLVVEDEKIIRENIIDKIAKCDPEFQVCGFAADGQHALKLIENSAPDVVITDIKMPVIDGLELIKRIKSTYPHIIVVIISGYADFTYAQCALRLNIEDYLVKPIKIDSLIQTLANIKNKLSVLKYNSLQNSWTRLVTLNEFDNSPQTLLQHENSLALINIGNLCSSFFSADLKLFYENKWRSIDLIGKFSDNIDIFLVDEHIPNTKVMIISDNGSTDLELLISKTFTYIKQTLPDVNINIIYSRINDISKIRDIMERLRITLNQQLVIGQDKIINLTDQLPTVPAVLISNMLRSKIIYLISNDQTETLKTLFMAEIKDTVNKSMPQAWIKDYFHQILRLIQQYSNRITEAELQHIEYTLFENMSYPQSVEMFNKNVREALGIILDNTADESYEDDGWITEVKTYLMNNYSNNISLDDVAKKFNYTASHMIKIFKRQTGETPMKYIINLRISTAKTLLKDEPSMDIKQICESVGYYDQHYFSRIFKSITGLSPSDYRQKYTNQ